MITADIPGLAVLELEHLVLDFTGTLARDGVLRDGVAPWLKELSQGLRVHVVTADTFGRARSALDGLPLELEILASGGEAAAKRQRVVALGARRCAAMGNGANDALMLQAAALSIAVVGGEGASTEALRAAQVAVRDPCDGLDLLLQPRRLVATLRR